MIRRIWHDAAVRSGLRFPATVISICISVAAAASSAVATPCCKACGDNIVTSASLTVQDMNGNIDSHATVTFSIDGGAQQSADCDTDNSAAVGCQSWSVGHDETGRFDIKARSADGSTTGEVVAELESDGCHVVPQTLRITLK
jgi:hypothetical protein